MLRACSEHREQLDYPEHEGTRDRAFQGWVIQKIAGLQLCINHLGAQLDQLQAE